MDLLFFITFENFPEILSSTSISLSKDDFDSTDESDHPQYGQNLAFSFNDFPQLGQRLEGASPPIFVPHFGQKLLFATSSPQLGQTGEDSSPIFVPQLGQKLLSPASVPQLGQIELGLS